MAAPAATWAARFAKGQGDGQNGMAMADMRGPGPDLSAAAGVYLRSRKLLIAPCASSPSIESASQSRA